MSQKIVYYLCMYVSSSYIIHVSFIICMYYLHVLFACMCIIYHLLFVSLQYKSYIKNKLNVSQIKN